MRAGRLLSLLLLLQNGGRYTAGELAERLGVSQRTVLRDIDVLSSSGVPIYATPRPTRRIRAPRHLRAGRAGAAARPDPGHRTAPAGPGPDRANGPPDGSADWSARGMAAAAQRRACAGPCELDRGIVPIRLLPERAARTGGARLGGRGPATGRTAPPRWPTSATASPTSTDHTDGRPTTRLAQEPALDMAAIPQCGRSSIGGRSIHSDHDRSRPMKRAPGTASLARSRPGRSRRGLGPGRFQRADRPATMRCRHRLQCVLGGRCTRSRRAPTHRR